jgi:hypothetical protein
MLAPTSISGDTMPTRDAIREVIVGAAEGATGCIEALAAAGAAALVEDFDVEVGLTPGGEGSLLSATVRFAVVVTLEETGDLGRSVA